jgi:hypothetical protein
MTGYNKHNLKYLLPAIIISLALISCAKIGSLSGGPKDMQAPKIDTTLSDENFQVRFFPEKIILHFDEWIELKNQSQILISPPLQFNPEINYRGKQVEVIFDKEEILRDSTTYAINFGDAIVDFTEANPVKNFRFVFATGDKIDSLSLNFKAVDAYSGKAIEDVTVMLYDENRDSIVYTDKPYYFARTDKTGFCTIQNMRSGKFKCFALKDGDFNLIYNQESELIGFLDSLIDVNTNDMVRGVVIELFLPLPDFQIVESTIHRRGKLKFLANRIVDQIDLVETNLDLIDYEVLHDSIFYWYQTDSVSADSVFMVFQYEDHAELDTFIMNSKRTTPFPGEIKFASFKGRKTTLNPRQALSLKLNQIIKQIDTSFFELMPEPGKPSFDTIDSLTIDTIFPPPVFIPFNCIIDSLDKRQIILDAKFEEGKKYILNLYPGALEGYYENSNDTLQTAINIELLENLGNIYCTFDSLDMTQQYVVLLKQKERVIDTKTINGQQNTRLDFLLMSPGNYNLEIIVDHNKNGRWDPGDYSQKRQAENKLDIKLDELKKNWDLETEIKWDGL